jgi:hypothetical protein
MYKGRRVFRAGPGMVALFVGLTVLFAGGAVLTYLDRGWDLVSIALAGAAVVLGVGSILASFRLRIELTDESLVITDLSGVRRYRVEDIERVDEAKGVPPVLLLKNGKWVKLPSVASDVGNSVRAWLKRR